MPRKNNHYSLDRLKTDTARIKLEIERIKLKTLEYELKIAADKKRYLSEDKEQKKTMKIMDMKDEFFTSIITSLQEQNTHLRTELTSLRASREYNNDPS